ncbi:MAG: ribosome biogenesis GTPase Der [Oligoflexales bacterium]|nr:ribosome biogenesis GTPase Der [Oligoflexales bacterium]
MIKGIVAIVGRPNTGKSTLFNSLTRSQNSLVSPTAGVTRDRLYGTVYDQQDSDHGFTLVDTAGIALREVDYDVNERALFQINGLIWQQTQKALEQADLVLFLVDGRSGLLPADHEILKGLRKSEKKFICVSNKIDGEEQRGSAFEFWRLGLPDAPVPISAMHRKGLKELLVIIREQLTLLNVGLTPSRYDAKTTANLTSVAIIGRPNAGKSSLLNRLVGEERSLVSEIPGTTRDPIDTLITYNKNPYLLIDTAGIRRKTKIAKTDSFLEGASVIRSLRAIDRADIVLFVVDGRESVTDQDSRLIHLALERYKPVLVVINKWDAVEDKDSRSMKQYEERINGQLLKDLNFVPIHFISCLHNKRVHKTMAAIESLRDQYRTRVSTAKVNSSIEAMVEAHPPHLISNHTKRFKFYFGTQLSSSPPTLVIKCNRADDLKEAYKRYMLKRFRQDFGLDNIPIRLILKTKNEKQPVA